MKRLETTCRCGMPEQVGTGRMNCERCARPVPQRPSPLVMSDPFWGEPPYTWAYVTLIAVVLGAVLAVALIVVAATS